MAENGHIKDVLKIAAMIKLCMASAKTYRALADCMAARVGYTQNAPLYLEADNVFAQSKFFFFFFFFSNLFFLFLTRK